jgi:hypothetical protein
LEGIVPANKKAAAAQRRLVTMASALLPEGGASTIFLGRIGEPTSLPDSRSIRLPFEDLILETPPQQEV